MTEIAPDVYRIGVYAPKSGLQFNFFLVRDDQPLLFTTGFRATFPALREAVARVIAPARIRWVGFSHFESDECGALNLWLEETQKTLLCSDLFHQAGDVEPLTESDLSDRVRAALSQMQGGPLANYIPYNARTEVILGRLADLKPKTLAIMHGSSFTGDGGRALRNLAAVMRETLGDPMSCGPPRR